MNDQCLPKELHFLIKKDGEKISYLAMFETKELFDRGIQHFLYINDKIKEYNNKDQLYHVIINSNKINNKTQKNVFVKTLQKENTGNNHNAPKYKYIIAINNSVNDPLVGLFTYVCFFSSQDSYNIGVSSSHIQYVNVNNDTLYPHGMENHTKISLYSNRYNKE